MRLSVIPATCYAQLPDIYWSTENHSTNKLHWKEFIIQVLYEFSPWKILEGGNNIVTIHSQDTNMKETQIQNNLP